MDDFSGSCGTGRYPLLTAVSRSLHAPSFSQVRQTSSSDYLLSRQVSLTLFVFVRLVLIPVNIRPRSTAYTYNCVRLIIVSRCYRLVKYIHNDKIISKDL